VISGDRRPVLNEGSIRHVAGVKLPEQDREGQPSIFDSNDLSPVFFGTGKSPRTSWFSFTEDELSLGAARVGNYKAVFNLRGDGAYDRKSHVGQLDKGLDEAQANGWTVVSMKDDWKTVFHSAD
jgi:arylsulfatase